MKKLMLCLVLFSMIGCDDEAAYNEREIYFLKREIFDLKENERINSSQLSLCQKDLFEHKNLLDQYYLITSSNYSLVKSKIKVGVKFFVLGDNNGSQDRKRQLVYVDGGYVILDSDYKSIRMGKVETLNEVYEYMLSNNYIIIE